MDSPKPRPIPRTRSRASWGDRVIIALALVCTFIAFSPFGLRRP